MGVEEEEEFAKVVDETRELHPSRLAVSADGLGGLEEVLDLAELGVWVRLVDEGVELLHGLPDGHLGSGLGVEIVAGLEVVGDCVLGVLFLVEVLYSVAGVLVLPELGLVLFGVEFGRIGHLLLVGLLGLVLEDVDVFNLIDHLLEGQAISISAEGTDGCLHSDRHFGW